MRSEQQDRPVVLMHIHSTVYSSDAVVVQRNTPFLHAIAPSCPRCDSYYTDPNCPCATTRNHVHRFNQAHIPARYFHATLDTIDAHRTDCQPLRRLYRWITAFATREPLSSEGMLVSGPCAVGKTHAIAALLRHVTLGRGVEALFVDWIQLLHNIKSAFAGEGNAHEHIDTLKRFQLLVLDDVADVNGSQWARHLLDEIISARYNAVLPTLLTTNLSLPSQQSYLAAPFDSWALEHTTSRLRQMCHWLTVTGPDKRMTRQ